MSAVLRGESDGVLSPSECEIAETESHRHLRLQLEGERHEAEAMRKWYHDKLRGGSPLWEFIQGYADWTGRLALVRDRQERFGLTP